MAGEVPVAQDKVLFLFIDDWRTAVGLCSVL